VVIDSDAAAGRALSETLQRLGHTVTHFGDPADAASALPRARAAVIFATTGEFGGEGRLVAAALADLPACPPIVWVGAHRDGASDLIRSGVGRSFVPAPVSESRARTALANLLPTEGDPRSDSWSGPAFLSNINGSPERFSPLRLLFLAHRVRASGRLEVNIRPPGFSVDLRGGRVVGCQGLPELLETLDIPGSTREELGTLLGKAVAAGHAMDHVMAAAARGLGLALGRTVGHTTGTVRFDPDAPGPSMPMSLAVPLPQIMAAGLREARSASRVRRELGRHRNSTLILRAPNDSPESAWGLPSVGLRLLRDAGRARTLGDLLGAYRGGETDELWLTLDLLMQWGILRLEQRTPERRKRPERRRQRRSSGGDRRRAPREESSGPVTDETLDMLQKTLARFETASPAEILELNSSKRAEDDAIDRLYREILARYHPDRFVGHSDAVRRVASECFARVTQAHQEIATPAARSELRERLKAEEEGRVYVSRSDARVARLERKKADVHIRRKAWPQAYRHARRAAELDPTGEGYVFAAVHTGWRAGDLSADDAIKSLSEMRPTNPKDLGDVYALIGEVLLAADRGDESYRWFEKCVDVHPQHTAARRHLRLREMRQKNDTGKGGGLKGLFRWGRKG